MKWAVVYSSLTGNTKIVAEKIAESIGNADIFEIKNAPENFSEYEVIFLGYWLKRGAPDPMMLKYLPKVHNVKVVFFQTHGTAVGSEHAVTAFARAGYKLGEGCEILGTFSCLGKINPALIEKRMSKVPMDFHGGVKAVERWKNAENHPDEEDLKNVVEFVERIKIKLERIRAFESMNS